MQLESGEPEKMSAGKDGGFGEIPGAAAGIGERRRSGIRFPMLCRKSCLCPGAWGDEAQSASVLEGGSVRDGISEGGSRQAVRLIIVEKELWQQMGSFLCQ